VVKRGEVWWYEPPELARRPVVVLTRNGVIEHLNQVVAAPLTRTIRNIPTEVFLDTGDGMFFECVVSLDNTMSVRRSMLTERITVLGPARMGEICDALRSAIEC
jgi:mRNA interferase MazF